MKRFAIAAVLFVRYVRSFSEPRPVQPPARRVVADDGDVGTEHLVAERVIVVIVRVDHVLDGLVRQRLDVGDERGRRRRR